MCLKAPSFVLFRIDAKRWTKSRKNRGKSESQETNTFSRSGEHLLIQHIQLPYQLKLGGRKVV